MSCRVMSRHGFYNAMLALVCDALLRRANNFTSLTLAGNSDDDDDENDENAAREDVLTHTLCYQSNNPPTNFNLFNNHLSFFSISLYLSLTHLSMYVSLSLLNTFLVNICMYIICIYNVFLEAVRECVPPTVAPLLLRAFVPFLRGFCVNPLYQQQGQGQGQQQNQQGQKQLFSSHQKAFSLARSDDQVNYLTRTRYNIHNNTF